MNSNLPPVDDEPGAPPPHVSFREAFLFWLKLGFISFGGPPGRFR